MRTDARRLGKKVQNNPYNHDLKRNYFRACKEYKKLNKRTKSAFFQNIFSQLDEINETNPKLFWKTFHFVPFRYTKY
jgi:hypothetical protein